MRITRQILGLAAASLFGVTATLRAQEVTFLGSAFGCITSTGLPCVPSTNPADYPTFATGFAGFNYDNDGFAFQTIGDHASVNDGFGAFSLATNPSPLSYNGFGVTLLLHFALPTAGDQTFQSASVFGTVNAIPGDGGVAIVWANGGLTTFNFTEIIGGVLRSGTATIDLNNLSLLSGAPNLKVNGNVTVTLVSLTPEPASIALFATGLVGMIPVVRYSRRKRA